MSQDIDLIAKALQTKDPKDVVNAFLVNSGKDCANSHQTL